MKPLRKAVRICWLSSVKAKDAPTGYLDAQSMTMIMVMRWALPVWGLMISKERVCPSATHTSPTAKLLSSLRMDLMTRSDTYLLPSLA